MKSFSKKTIIKIVLITIAILFCDIKINYGAISGYAKEYNEETGEETPIPYVKVELYDFDDNSCGSVITDTNGEYKFTNIPEEDEYFLKFTWGNIEEVIGDIDTIQYDEDKIKVIQNILKYNFQDYDMYDGGEIEIDDTERLNDFNDYFSEIKYSNTALFQAINMKVEQSNFDLFKKYAKELSLNTYMTAESIDSYELNNSDDVTGPILYLIKKPEFILSQKLNITGMRINDKSGVVMSLKEGYLGGEEPLLEYEEREKLYGAELQLEYTLEVKNYAKQWDNKCTQFSAICMVPTGCEYIESQEFITGNSEEDEFVTPEEMNQVKVEKKLITKDNILDLSDYYKIGNENRLDKTNLYNDIVNNNKNAVLVNVKFDGKDWIDGDNVKVKFLVNKLLNGIEEDPYEGSLEMLEYSNSENRRMQMEYDPEVPDRKISEEVMIAGDGEESQGDFVRSLNQAVIIPPTGKDKRVINIVAIIVVLSIMGIIIKNRIRN